MKSFEIHNSDSTVQNGKLLLVERALLLVLALLSGVVYAQKVDTLNKSREVLQQSVIQEAQSSQRKLDSIQNFTSIHRFRDSLKITSWSDSLRRKVEDRFSPQQITNKLDSLKGLNISTDRVTHFSDSLLRRKAGLLSEVTTKQHTLQSKVTARYDGWMKGVREKFNLDSAGIKTPSIDPAVGDPLQKLNLPNTAKLPQGSVPGANLPSGSMATLPAMPSLNTEDFSSLGLSQDLTTVGGDIAIPSMDQLGGMEKNLPAMPDPMKEITGKAGEFKAITKDPGAAAEATVSKISDVNSATQQLKDAEQLTQNNEALQAGEQLKDPEGAKEVFQRQAFDHFQGKEAVLQQAMDQMAKYKDRYPSLASLADVKKSWLPPNSLKGKPFRERFRIGMHVGFRNTKDTLLLDFFPNASYRISGRFEAGMGFMYRLRVQTNNFGFDQQNPVWGINTFVVAKTFKSVYLRLEVDGNSYPVSSTTETPSYRDWRWSFLSGIQTNFAMGKQWSGNVQMLYNFDSQLKDGFPERLALRLGVQYRLKAK